MDYVQFSLFFAALLIGYVLIHLRLVKFEVYLKEIAGLKQLNERLKGVADAMAQIRVDPLEEGLAQLHEDAGEILDGVRSLERRAAHPVDRVVEVVTEQGPSKATIAERICSAIEERLFGIGYNKITILTDLTGVQIEDEISVQVECEKNMMPCKGTVVARNGAITEVDVHSVVKMFP